MDEIYDQGAQELDENKRKVLYDEFQRIAAGELPVIYTVLNIDMFAVRNKFGNLKPTVNGGVFNNITYSPQSRFRIYRILKCVF